MLIAKQRGLDYFHKSKPCKNHNRKMLAKKEGDMVRKICERCGAEIKASKMTDIVIGVFSPLLDGVIIKGFIKLKVKAK